jgi:hypothetical protein
MTEDAERERATLRQRDAENEYRAIHQRLVSARDAYAAANARAEAALDARDGVQAVIEIAEAETLRPEYHAAQEAYRLAADELRTAIEACLALGRPGRSA